MSYISTYSLQTDTDEPIQNMTLAGNEVRENSKIGEKIGVFDAHDPDIHRPRTMTFSLVDNTPFALQGKNNEILVVNESLNFEENSDYVFNARVTDSIGRGLQTTFIIKVLGEYLNHFLTIPNASRPPPKTEGKEGHEKTIDCHYWKT